MEKYLFDKPLQEALIIKRNSQFTMDILINGQIEKAHCPTTNRIGDIETKNIACLISHSANTSRKLKYTVEAISCDDIDAHNKNWIGINQILSNKLVEFFLKNNALENMIGSYTNMQREVYLGNAKLDFLVDNTYIEVKTPLTTLHVNYGKNIQTKPITPFSSTDRFVKHITELTNALDIQKRAILLTVHQYMITNRKEHLKSTKYALVKETMEKAIKKGVETWCLDMKFEPDGVSLISCINTTYDSIKD